MNCGRGDIAPWGPGAICWGAGGTPGSGPVRPISPSRAAKYWLTFFALLPQSTRANFESDRMATWMTPGSSWPTCTPRSSPHDMSDIDVDMVIAPVAGSAALTVILQRGAARQAASKTAWYSAW